MSEGKNVDIIVKDVYNWKEIKSNYFEVVITGQTLEHIKYPWFTMCEISRILKYDGLCCIIVPSSGPEHRYPIDCYRFFPDGLKALAEYANLDVIECYNCWNDNPKLKDGNIWKDTVLICSKRNVNILTKFKHNIKLSLLKWF
jgi:SAM-dependent methyltransferase